MFLQIIFTMASCPNLLLPIILRVITKMFIPFYRSIKMINLRVILKILLRRRRRTLRMKGSGKEWMKERRKAGIRPIRIQLRVSWWSGVNVIGYGQGFDFAGFFLILLDFFWFQDFLKISLSLHFCCSKKWSSHRRRNEQYSLCLNL